MFTGKRRIACALATAALLALTACGKPADTTGAPAGQVAVAVSAQALSITSWGPQTTEAGKAFNIQPDGIAAVWVRLNRSLDGDEVAIEFNGTLLPGNISGALVTAAVPAKLYAAPGSFKVHVIARKGEQSTQSNDVTFTVK